MIRILGAALLAAATAFPATVLVVLGSGTPRVLQFAGHEVVREYYFNDAGTQIEKLGESIRARARGDFGYKFFRQCQSIWSNGSHHGIKSFPLFYRRHHFGRYLSIIF